MNRHFANLWSRRAAKRRRRSSYQPLRERGTFRALGCEQLERRALLTAAATITWSGAVDANWSTPGNWDLNRAPVNGDSLVFPANAQHLANTDDISGLSVNSITFQGTETIGNGYTLNGDDLTVGSGGIVDNAMLIPPGIPNYSGITSDEIDFNVALGAAQSWSNNDTFGQHHLTVSGNVNNDAFLLTATGRGVIDVVGQISGSGGLDVTANNTGPTPTIELHGANSYTGATEVGGGTLVVDGSTAGASAVHVDSLGALGGTGTIGGGITVEGGDVSPGAAPDPSADTGTLATTGDVAIAGFFPPAGEFQVSKTAVFAVQLGGTATAATNDQLNAAGTVSFGGATLDLTTLPGAGPFNAGQQFVIIQAGAPITTTFDGLAEGSTVSDGAQNFTISYTNDRVTLTALPAAPATITWTGGSPTSSNWSDPANWNLGRAPVSGDSLVFPVSAQHLTNTNDISGLSVNSITFQGDEAIGADSYTLSGDDLTVGSGGIVDNVMVAPPPIPNTGDFINTNQINFNVALGAAQSWSNNDASVYHHLAVNGNVNNGGFLLTATGRGIVDVAGQISGSGGVSVGASAAGSTPTLELQNANTYTGNTGVGAGTLIVVGSTADASAVSVAFGGILGGTGTVGGKITLMSAGGAVGPGGPVVSAGTLDPGAGPDPSQRIGTLSNTGGVSFVPSTILAPNGPGGPSGPAQFAVQLGGTTASPAHDELDSAGTVSLEPATLDLTALPGAGPFNAGQQFVIVQAGAPITTTFSGLAEGSTVSDGTQNFTISYANDRVTLTALQFVSPQSDTYLNGQTADSTAATLVHNLYRELLGREPGAQEQAAWVNYYNQVSATAGPAAAQQTVVAGFLSTPEYRQHLVEVIYGNFLHRAADSAGLAFWTGQLAAGVDEKNVLIGIIGSDEYFQDTLRVDNLSVRPAQGQSWVEALYRDVLGRAADAGGLVYWTQQVMAQNNQSGRAAVASAFLSTPEVDHKLLNADYPGAAGSVGAPGTPAVGAYALADLTGNGWDNLYFQGRLSAGAVDSYFAGLQSGVSYDETIARMLDSGQYFTIILEPMAKS